MKPLGLICMTCFALFLVWGCASDDPVSPPVIEGTWGAEGVILELDELGGTIGFWCADGTVDEPVTLGGDNDFAVHGEMLIGPVPRVTDAVEYRGTVRNDRMDLRIVLVDLGEVFGDYELTRGFQPVIQHCQ
jgi:hypothetical protein